MSRRLRVFMGFEDVAGYYTNLQKGFTRQGVDARVIDEKWHPFAYQREGPSPGVVLRLFARIGTRRQRLGGRSLAVKLFWAIPHIVLRGMILVWACVRFDVFIFSFGTSFARHYELPLLKRLGKTTIHVYHGTDARPFYMHGSNRDLQNLPLLLHRERRRRRLMTRAESWADAIVDHPPTGQYHSRRFIKWLCLGIPMSVDDVRGDRQPCESPEGAPLRIVHAPSRPREKGSAEFKAVIETLRKEGHAIDYVELSGVPNGVVLDELSRCDLVLDELYSDTLMAGLAAEAACFGKPAVVGGYYGVDGARRDHPETPLPPVAHAVPESVEAVVRHLVEDVDARRRLGEQAYEFVRTQWAAKAVAGRYLDIVCGRVPARWTFDPADSHYTNGWGMPLDAVRETVSKVVHDAGLSALGVDDKPGMRDALERMVTPC